MILNNFQPFRKLNRRFFGHNFVHFDLVLVRVNEIKIRISRNRFKRDGGLLDIVKILDILRVSSKSKMPNKVTRSWTMFCQSVRREVVSYIFSTKREERGPKPTQLEQLESSE